MAGRRSHDNVAGALRDQLEQIDLQHNESLASPPAQPAERGASDSDNVPESTSSSPHDAQAQEAPWTPLTADAPRARPHARFAGPDTTSRETTPRPLPRRARTEPYVTDLHTSAKTERAGQFGHLVPGDPQLKRASSSEDHRFSLAQPRQRFDDLHGDVDTAMTSARETNATLTHYRNWVGRRREKKRKRTKKPWGRIRAAAATYYQRYIIEGLLRQKPLPPSAEGRHIPLQPGLARRKPLEDERTARPYVANFIRSSRYTVWDFLPKQLFFQFSKLANFYFLVIGIMQLIPGLSTTGTYTTIGPLIFFVGFSIAKEGYDDYRRYQLDKQENRSSTWVLDPEHVVKPNTRIRRRAKSASKDAESTAAGADSQMTELEEVRTGEQGGRAEPWSEVEWQDVRVGDIIRLQRDDNVPADIVLLHATGPNGMAYIETMALDGETNLKSKHACPLLAGECDTIAGMASCEAEVVSEDPNIDLYNYEGRVTVKGKTMPLTLNQVVYRGSTLRNTAQAVGLVVNTGEECKIRMNAHKNVHAKAPEMQYAVNRIVILLVLFVVALSIGLTIGYQIWRHRYERQAWYFMGETVPLKEILIGFIIVFNTLIPLSLYVSLEIIKLGQLYFLRDVEMYDPVTDTPMVANTSTILENLGQVSYVFSDKTGTLTENIMKFRKMSVAGTAWLHDRDLREAAKKRQMSPSRGRPEKEEKGRKSFTRRRRAEAPAPVEPKSIDEDDSEPPRSIRQSTTSRPGPTVKPSTTPELLNTDDLIRYICNKPNTPFARKVRHFIICMALCHTCLPEITDDGETKFQAASPDELALVEAARDLGYLLIDRPAQSIKLQSQDANGSTTVETYEVLDVIEFSSKRKRMSIIIRMPDGKICMFIKGADSTVLPRLKQRNLVVQAASAVERRASLRKSMEQEKALRRLSLQSPTRTSMTMGRGPATLDRRGSRIGDGRKSFTPTADFDTWLSRRENGEHSRRSVADEPDQYLRLSFTRAQPSVDTTLSHDLHDSFIDESLSLNEAAVFERCFHHVDDFASEGLRTLIYAYRYLGEDEYAKWKEVYQSATTSLVNRQEQIEAAAELIEQGFDLAGATAIEDKLQHGVPETIDNLHRANMKVWMLTGDKRETAINIAHSARICKPYSEVYIIDATQHNLQEKVASTLIDVGRGMVPHSVVVIDGHTLSVVEQDESLKILFFDLVARVDSVICCRASPSQKATLVKSVRQISPSAVTLAIGDGANDIAMIQASHVGIGISGREGLQAARISDYSIAQFRFLQRLLFVHGRWIYIRTGKYILGTFWKEMMFYVLQAHFQQYNGFTGTSLFESTSLTVFNTIFTSLPVIVPGIFEQDLSAKTLMAVPELYTFGQRNMGFNLKLYFGWTFVALSESVIIFYTIYFLYARSHSPVWVDLFPVGQLAFGVSVIFINIKLFLMEMRHRNIICICGCLLSLLGWFLWNIILAVLYNNTPGPYRVHDGFISGFGRSLWWWCITFLALSALVVFEVSITAVRRTIWPTDQDVMQEIEQVDGVVYLLKNGGMLAAGADAEHGHREKQPDGSPSVTVMGGSEGSEGARRFSWPWRGGGSGRDKMVARPPVPPSLMEELERETTTTLDSGEGSTAKVPRARISEDPGKFWIQESDSMRGEGNVTQSPIELQSPRSGLFRKRDGK